MKAFHNDPEIKEKYLLRVKAHQLADEIIKGQYWKKNEDGIFRGCAVGCTLHSSNHSAYEDELGIPKILATLEDGIFENLPEARAKLWPYEFLDAIDVGVDLSGIWPKFAVWLLTDETNGVLKYAKTDKSKKAIQQIADYYEKYSEITLEQWRAAAAAAYAAAAAADAAAAAAAAAAADAAAAAAAAADAAADAAAAAYAAADAAAAYAADARLQHRIAQANKLLELLREAK